MADLLSIIFSSSKRKRLLLLLRDGPRTWEEIKELLQVTASGMLPQIHILEREGIVIREGKEYRLSDLGGLIVHFMDPLVTTIDVLERNKKYWCEHNIGALPMDMLHRIGELKNIGILECPVEESFEPHAQFLNRITQSSQVKGISPVVHPRYPQFFLEGAKNGKEISLILTRNAYDKIKKEYSNFLERGLQYDNASLYVFDGDIYFAFIVTEKYFSLSLFFNNGVFDSKNDLVSSDFSSLKWGNDLFEYYRTKSGRITNLE